MDDNVSGPEIGTGSVVKGNRRKRRKTTDLSVTQIEKALLTVLVHSSKHTIFPVVEKATESAYLSAPSIHVADLCEIG